MGSRLPLAGKKTAVVSCCHESVDWGIAVKTRRNGRKMKKQGEQSWRGWREEGGRKWRKTQEEERRQQRAGDGGCVSLLSCLTPPRGLSLLCVFRDDLERSCDWSTLHWVAPARVMAVLGMTPKKKRRKHVWGRGDREARKKARFMSSILPKNGPRYLFQ